MTGNDDVFDVAHVLRRIAKTRRTRETAFDSWRFMSPAGRIEREHGVEMIECPQSAARIRVASERLHGAMVEGRLRHANDP